ILHDEVREALANLEKVREALEMQAGRLSSLSDGAVSDVSRLEGQIAGRCKEVSSATGRAISDLRALDENMEDVTLKLEARSEKATGSVQTVIEALEQTA